MPCYFGRGGLQQFVLDVRYIQASSRGVLPGEEHPARVLLRDALERAVVGYCLAYDEDIDALLLSDDWHEQVIRLTMGAMSSITECLFLPND
jgi:hypothetical protein